MFPQEKQNRIYPVRLFLKKTVPYFSDETVGGVQSKVRIYNTDHSTLASIQDDEFASFSTIIQKGRDYIRGAAALGGNGQLNRKKALNSVAGWNEDSITEDLELTVRLYLAGWSIRYCDTTFIRQEGVTGLRALFRQRTRWAAGHIETFLENGWDVLRSDMPFNRKFDLSIYLAGIITPLPIALSYFFGFLGIFINIKNTAAINPLAWVYISFAFFPVILAGVYKEITKNPLTLLFRSARMFIYAFHWIPVFFWSWPSAMISGYREKPQEWKKTAHNGTKPP
ncbi:MAG: glycosyltransferase family 2 protein [Euryarchaeota archaeon]|nr:glycosyltransferase family 2 protein [Euryarchaeota archaeon]